MRSYAHVAIVAALLGFTVSPSVAEETELSTRNLDQFIGKWRFVDEATELAGFEYRED